MLKGQVAGRCGVAWSNSSRRPRSTAITARVSSSSSSSTIPTTSRPPTLQQYDEFELLWLEFRHGLSISKAAATSVLRDVQQGLLPADAELLRARAQQFAALRRQLPRLDTLRILNSSITGVLKHDAGQLQQAVARLLQLLPGASPTELVLDTAAELGQRLPVEAIALQYSELGLLFQTALGGPISGPAFRYLLRQLQLQEQLRLPEQQKQEQQERTRLQVVEHKQQPAEEQPAEQQEHAVSLASPAAVLDQLMGLKQLLGPELASAALASAPQLLSAPLQRAAANLQWLQWRLRLTPVAALLLAEQQAGLLLLPPAVLQANYASLCYLLQQLLGWRLQQVHTLLCNAPQLLVAGSKQLAGRWQKVQRCCRRRRAWGHELAEAGPALAAAVLGCRGEQLLMLQYAADTRDLPRKKLIQVLADEQYVDFVRACPGFRVWRSMGAGRWRFDGATAAVDRAGCQPAAQASDGAPLPAGGSSRERAPRVLAVDALNRPVLLQVGERSHRLV